MDAHKAVEIIEAVRLQTQLKGSDSDVLREAVQTLRAAAVSYDELLKRVAQFESKSGQAVK